jgi:hypothetical protein
MGPLWKLARASWLAVTGVCTFVLFLFDATEKTGQIEDLEHSKEIWEKALGWLLTTPWWVPALLFVVMTASVYLTDIRRIIGLPTVRTAPPKSWLRSTVIHDMPIAQAIDYIVNDSRQKLRQPAPPHIGEFGPAKGKLIIQRGVEHADALALLYTKLISGEIVAWGRRSDARVPNQFEDEVREIPRKYWESASLHPVMCFLAGSGFAQTTTIPGRGLPGVDDSNYSALTVARSQIETAWPRQLAWIRLLNWIRRSKKITYWGEAPQ